LDTSVERVEFARQLYNLRHVLEREEESEDTETKIRQLQNEVEKHNKGRMKSFHTGDRDAGATDCAELEAELEAHGYEVEPRDFVDESGGVFKPLSDVRQPLSTYAPR
jgi:hypothetical protein